MHTIETFRLLVLMLLLGLSVIARSQSFTPISSGAPVTVTGAWRSVNWIDYNRDGFLDLFVTRGKAGGQDNVLFRSNGPPTFAFTPMSGLVISQDHKPSDGSSWADIDNDGDLDCFVANWYNQNNLLYINNGDGSFTQVLAGPVVTNGGYSETGSWGDFNNDGLVDLYVANSAGGNLNFLYRNIGSTLFQRITTGVPVTDAFRTRGVNWIDFDDDGDVDLFAANEAGANENLYRNMIVESGVDTFARVTGDPLLGDSGETWSGSWADYDNDGDLDVFLTNSGGEKNSLFGNNGDGTFTKILTGSIPTDSGWSASAAWGDFDNDGDLDLAVSRAYAGSATTNLLYKNLLNETGVPDLQRITSGPVVTDPGYSYGVSWGDFDEDGDLDLFFARTFNEDQTNALYRNDGTTGHWLTVECRGVASNATAIGARITVDAVINGSRVVQQRIIEGQNGYCSQNLLAHFGLGDAGSIDSLVVVWPSGNREKFIQPSIDRHIIIVENDSASPAAVAPAAGYVNTSTDVTLKWSRARYFPPYRLQVATDSTFSSGIVVDTIVTPDTSARVRVLHPHTRYYWRVRSDRSVYENSWSDVRYLDNDIAPPGSVQYLLPALHAENIPLNMLFRWRATANAVAFHLVVSTDSQMTAIALDTTLTDTSLAWYAHSNLVRYFWKVHGKNVAGESPVAVSWDFTTIDLAPPTPVLVSPPDLDVNTGHPVLLTWNPALRATAYRVQVAADNAFAVIVADDSSATTSISPGALGSFEYYYWRVSARNSGGSSAFSATWSFRTRLTAPVTLSPAEGAEITTNAAFRWASSSGAAGYHLQLSEDSAFASFVLDDSTLTDTSATQLGLPAERVYYWRVRSWNPQSVSDWSGTRMFVTSLKQFIFRARNSWNLISVPVTVPDLAATSLYPGALSRVYSFAGAYASKDTLAYGQGYWIKANPSQEFILTGAERLTDTIDLAGGWNLVGSVSTPIPVSRIILIPAGIPLSDFFGFDGSYRAVDTIFPGNGYWVKAGSGGRMVFSSSPSSAIGGAKLAVHELPPNPPSGGEKGGEGSELPVHTGLDQNFPNPFNPITNFEFRISNFEFVWIKVYDVLGREVATLVNEPLQPGTYRKTWDATNAPSGVYIVELTAGTFREMRKMALAR